MSENNDNRTDESRPPLVPPAETETATDVSDADLRDLGRDVDSESETTSSTSAAPVFIEPAADDDDRATAVHDTPAETEEPAARAEPVNPYDRPRAGERSAVVTPAASAEPAAAEALVEPAEPEPATAAYAPVEPAAYAPVVPVADDRPAHQEQTGYAQQQPQQQRVFVAAPIAQKKRGNRGIGSLIAALSGIIFAAVYAGVGALVIAASAPGRSVDGYLLDFIASPIFWVPAILYIVAFIIVVLLANRANWWVYVIGSLVVALVVYFGTIGIRLLTENVFAMTPQEASIRFAIFAINPFGIAAAFVAREVSIWTGTAIAARGRRMKARNVEARAEFERASELHRAEYERGYTPVS